MSLSVVDLGTRKRPSGDVAPILLGNKPRQWAAEWLRSRLSYEGLHTLAFIGGKGWFQWDTSGLWRHVEDSAVHSAGYEFLDGCKVNRKGVEGDFADGGFNPKGKDVSELLLATRSYVHKPQPESEPAWLTAGDEGVDPKWIVAINGGWLDLSQPGCIEHHMATPGLFTRAGAIWQWEAMPTCPEWIKFLRTLWPESDEQMGLLQEAIGLLMSGETKFQKIIALDGPTRSGKGVIIKVVESLVGAGACGFFAAHALAESFGIQAMIGKRIAINPDFRVDGQGARAAISERLLQISAGDRLQVQRKNLGDFEGTLNVRLLIGCNGLPRLLDDAGALPGRFLPVVMTRSFLGREDHGLLDRLLPEMAGIADWAHRGLHRLLKRGRFDLPEENARRIEALRLAGSPVRSFLESECIMDPTNVEDGTNCEALLAAYREWAERNSERTLSMTALTQALARIDPRHERKKRKGGRAEPRKHFYTGAFHRPYPH